MGTGSGRPPHGPHTRTVWVEPGRVAAWLDGFSEQHDGLTVDGREVQGGDGCRAALSWWTDLATSPAPPGEGDVPQPLGILLVRRGGYAVARMESGKLVASKAGRRWVQGRTAAGGWSQQRYQRRRENQAQALVGAVVEHATSVLAGVSGLAVDGDRALVEAVREGVGERCVAVPTRQLGGLGDPDRDVIVEAVRRAHRIRLDLTQHH